MAYKRKMHKTKIHALPPTHLQCLRARKGIVFKPKHSCNGVWTVLKDQPFERERPLGVRASGGIREKGPGSVHSDGPTWVDTGTRYAYSERKSCDNYVPRYKDKRCTRFISKDKELNI